MAQFDGVTHFPQKSKGIWKVGKATFFDEIIILRVLTDGTQANFWHQLKENLQRQWKQKHILIIARNVNEV